jgi:hypothetical protein
VLFFIACEIAVQAGGSAPDWYLMIRAGAANP